MTAQIQPPPRLSRPDAPAYSLSGTALTEAMKISIQSASCGYREAVPLLSQLLRRFQNADYGEENPERVQSNQLHLTANKGEVTGFYPTPALDQPAVCISQLLPYEKGPVIMLGHEYQPIVYDTPPTAAS